MWHEVVDLLNLFKDNLDDFQYILQNMGKTIYIDDIAEKAILSHKKVNENYDDIIIKTLYPIERGDLITYENQKYLILSQVNSDRFGLYKGLMRKCNFIIHVHVDDEKVLIGYEPSGAPIYEYRPIYEDHYAIVSTKVAQWSTGFPINLPDGELEVTIKDTGSTLITVGDTFDFEGLTWSINWVDRSEEGLLILKCKND